MARPKTKPKAAKQGQAGPAKKARAKAKIQTPKKPADKTRYVIYLISKVSKGKARLVASRGSRSTTRTTFSERYARRFPSEEEALKWLDEVRIDITGRPARLRREAIARFRPMILKADPDAEKTVTFGRSK